jgi:radical SAM superfamily enzyme YgiQ (UPF0313 family)
MAKSLYLINPRSDTPSYFGAEVFEQFGFVPTQGIADLACVTVAAMAPKDWQVTVCDEFVDPVDFDSDADFIGLTGKFNQRKRMIEISEEFQRRGKTVIFGGPFASLCPEDVRDHCNILVVGEMEEIAESFFADLESGNWQEEYVVEDKPDLSLSPIPRWELYPNDRTQSACLQTSRGCPFECEFCDVIQYLGRKQRHKAVDQIVAELDVLYKQGYRLTFLADDNFTVYRKRAKEVLSALRDWNAKQTDGPMAFGTQVSIDAARDPEIMQLCAEAGMIWVFIGIETPNVESLKETKKRQNVGVDLVSEIQVFLDYGIAPMCGMIVGFDNDGLDIFQRQYDFAMETAVPYWSLGALEAPKQTPLYTRLEEAGRLVNELGSASTPWHSNVIPTQMTKEQQVEGLRWLCNSLYEPEAFGKRMLEMIERMGPHRGPFADGVRQVSSQQRALDTDSLNLMRKFVRQGKAERKMYLEIAEAMADKPEAGPATALMLFRYTQARCLYESGSFWDPHVEERSPFEAAAVAGAPANSGLVTIGS